MTAQIIDGKKIAAETRAAIKTDVETLKKKGVQPGLATLLVGEDPASKIYVASKHKACQEAGMNSFNHTLPKDASTETVLAKVRELNADPKVHGMLIQLPLPPQVDSERVLEAVTPAKDADGFHPTNLGRLISAKDMAEIYARNIPIPCTPLGCLLLVESTGLRLAGKNAVVVGRSLIVGKPAAALLLASHCTVTIAHSRTQNLDAVCREADILVAAVGKAKMIEGSWIKEGAVVIDVGINRSPEGKIFGDVDFDAASARAGWITPVPGGVGPMTIAMLLKNTVALARKHARPV
ncbi:MAG: bifunctional 5,10-methylene-tetrahydrofolate dehydrogenase/5,10-methylene-tetrahydrofolate cyclohydrolase [Elusimicrobia bacterium RIFCSPLOWO2_01_FULL_54_10]|nr:MAG: bifunctional 5,10-methylene-tetrahydrofolate dehydrogenase/5,10-methylene-tetrahydrofolate cyclohydrolase [Elusimicrobia bacterium RIFCSPLOWO2_01_FULL_54_10]